MPLSLQVTGSFKTHEDKIKTALASVSKVAFTLDGWTSPFKSCFLAVTAHFIDEDWELQDLTLGFEHLTGEHTGVAMMKAFVRVVKHFGLQRKVAAITSDNGSNVIKLTKELQKFTAENLDTW